MSVPATYFDIPGTPREKWSVATFGEKWDSEWCHGTVLKVLSATVRWDIDGHSQRVGVANLQLEAEEGRLEPPAEERRVFQPLSYSCSSDAFDEENSSSSDSDDEASESESEDESDIQSQSRQEGGPSQPQHSNAKRKKSPAKVDHTHGKVTAHGLEWKFVDVSVDAYKDNRYKPKQRAADPASKSVLDFWLLFFPGESIGEIVQETNARLKSRQEHITNGELFKAIGLLYTMTLDVRRQHWDYWATASTDYLFPTLAFSIRRSFRNWQRSL